MACINHTIPIESGEPSWLLAGFWFLQWFLLSDRFYLSFFSWSTACC